MVLFVPENMTLDEVRWALLSCGIQGGTRGGTLLTTPVGAVGPVNIAGIPTPAGGWTYPNGLRNCAGITSNTALPCPIPAIAPLALIAAGAVIPHFYVYAPHLNTQLGVPPQGLLGQHIAAGPPIPRPGALLRLATHFCNVSGAQYTLDRAMTKLAFEQLFICQRPACPTAAGVWPVVTPAMTAWPVPVPMPSPMGAVAGFVSREVRAQLRDIIVYTALGESRLFYILVFATLMMYCVSLAHYMCGYTNEDLSRRFGVPGTPPQSGNPIGQFLDRIYPDVVGVAANTVTNAALVVKYVACNVHGLTDTHTDVALLNCLLVADGVVAGIAPFTANIDFTGDNRGLATRYLYFPAEFCAAVGICQRLCRISGIYTTNTKVRLGTMVARPTPGSNLPSHVRTKDFNNEVVGEGQDLGLLEISYLICVLFIVNRVAIFGERRRLNRGGAIAEWRYNICNSRLLPVPRLSPLLNAGVLLPRDGDLITNNKEENGFYVAPIIYLGGAQFAASPTALYYKHSTENLREGAVAVQTAAAIAAGAAPGGGGEARKRARVAPKPRAAPAMSPIAGVEVPQALNPPAAEAAVDASMAASLISG